MSFGFNTPLLATGGRFTYDGQTGAEINGNLVTLHFVDGQRGDDDLTPDGKIIDQGGPGSPPIPVPVFNAIGLLALIGILSVVLAVATLKRKRKYFFVFPLFYFFIRPVAK